MTAAIRGYCFAEKKKVAIVSHIQIKKRAVKNGRVVTIAVGLTRRGNRVASILENLKAKPCPPKKTRGKKGGCVSKKSPNKAKK